MSTELLSGERQVAETLDGIRADHRARYVWAAERLAGRCVVDAACGVGYGSTILAGAGCSVRAFDRSSEAIAFAREHYNHNDRINYLKADLFEADYPFGYDAVVCFEALEHLEDPAPVLKRFREWAPQLLVSVPNETRFPFRRHAFHHRHYTAHQLEQLLNENGWQVAEWWGQEGIESSVERNRNGRTLVAVCERSDQPTGGTADQVDPPKPVTPRSVAIIAMGPSWMTYGSLAFQAGDRHLIADETWAINAAAGTIQHDRVFHMDDMRLQEMRAAARPKSNVAGLCRWLRTHPGPIYTSRAYPEFPGAVEYPLAEVMTKTRHGYFNNTVAYALAYALYLDVQHIHLYGADFSYPQSHKREKGRGCVEFWLGIASMRGVEISLAQDTTLLDAVVPEGEKFYGYDADILKVELGPNGFSVEKTPRELPSVEEVERRYSHDPDVDDAT